MVPTLLVASNWQPRVNSSLSDPAGFDPSKPSAALWEISLKYIRTQLVTILCSNYSGQRRDRSPRADALGLNPVYLLLRLAHLPHLPSPPRHHHSPQNRCCQVSHAIRNARCLSEVAVIEASRENGTDGGVVTGQFLAQQVPTPDDYLSPSLSLQHPLGQLTRNSVRLLLFLFSHGLPCPTSLPSTSRNNGALCC
jgi:hypothetical protein